MTYFTNFSNLTVTDRTTSNTTTVFNSANIGSDDTLVIYGGVNGSVLQTDGTGNLVWVDPRGSVDPNSIPATRIFFNDQGSFGGSANLTFNSNTQSISGMSSVNSGGANVVGVIQIPTPPSISGGYANQQAVTLGGGNLEWRYTGDGVKYASFTPSVNLANTISTGATQFIVSGNQTSTFAANTVVAFSENATNLFRIANSVYNSGSNTTTVNTTRPIIVNTTSTGLTTAVESPENTNILVMNDRVNDSFPPGAAIYLTNQQTGAPFFVDASYVDYADSGRITATQLLPGRFAVQGYAINSFFPGNQLFIGTPNGQIYTLVSTPFYVPAEDTTYWSMSPAVDIPAGQPIYFAYNTTTVQLTTNLTNSVPAGATIYVSQPILSGTTVYIVGQSSFSTIQFVGVDAINFAPKLGIAYPNPTTNPAGVVINSNGVFGGDTTFTFSDTQILSTSKLNINSGSNVALRSNGIAFAANAQLNFTNAQSSQTFIDVNQTANQTALFNGTLNFTTPSYNSTRSRNTDNKYTVIEGTPGSGYANAFSYGSQYCISAVPAEVTVSYQTNTKVPTNGVKYNSITGLYYDTVNNGWVNGSGENMVVYVNYNVFWEFDADTYRHATGAKSVWLSVNGDITRGRYGSDNQHVNAWSYGFPPFGDNYTAPLAQTGGAVLYLEPGDRIELWVWHNSFTTSTPQPQYIGGGNPYRSTDDGRYYTYYIYSSAQSLLASQASNFVDTGYSSWLQISRLDR